MSVGNSYLTLNGLGLRTYLIIIGQNSGWSETKQKGHSRVYPWDASELVKNKIVILD